MFLDSLDTPNDQFNDFITILQKYVSYIHLYVDNIFPSTTFVVNSILMLLYLEIMFESTTLIR
jgi:hypothetical protein